MRIEEKLKIVKVFQDKYPDAHLGGSLGLLLHGIDLKRDYWKSDIDMTMESELNEATALFEGLHESSAPGDFDCQFRYYPNGSSLYTKIDIRRTPEPSFVVINYEGIDYNVSRLKDILFWKKKYADMGSTKHINDLIVINGGERPDENIDTRVFTTDDLPF